MVEIAHESVEAQPCVLVTHRERKSRYVDESGVALGFKLDVGD